MRTAAQADEAPKTVPRRREKIVQVAIPGMLLERIEAARAKARIPTSRTRWIVEALADHMDRLDAEAKEKNAR